MADKEAQQPDETQIRLNFRIPSRMPSVYAQHMFIQQGQHEVVLSFFEVFPPIFIEEATEERIKTLLETGVVAECVARITVAKESFPEFAKAMQKVAKQIADTQEETQNADNPRNNPES